MGLDIFMDSDVMNGRPFGGDALEAYNKARKGGKSH